MQSPEGEEFPNVGCFLEVTVNRRLVWTGALGADFRPQDLSGQPFAFTAVIEMEPKGNGTRYVATGMHSNAEGRKKHEAMGFEVGWGIALEQLVALMKKQ
jgi:uncharacterized protein YndB with AHSA1/START domain